MRAGTVDAVLERIATAAARRLQVPAEHILSIPGIRRGLARRALRAWRSTDTPLILCHGNINRSPFAAALARDYQAKSPASAGFYPVAGRCPPELTIVRAAEYGVDLSTHRSAIVEPRQLEGAPAIFVFDLVNLAPIACRWPRALHRTHLLPTLSPTGAPFVPDPHGEPIEILDNALRRISDAISATNPMGLVQKCEPGKRATPDGPSTCNEDRKSQP